MSFGDFLVLQNYIYGVNCHLPTNIYIYIQKKIAIGTQTKLRKTGLMV